MGQNTIEVEHRKKVKKFVDLQITSDFNYRLAKISVTHYGEFIEVEDGYNLQCLGKRYEEGT